MKFIGSIDSRFMKLIYITRSIHLFILGVVSGMSGRSGLAGASFAGLSALGDSLSYADSILAETVSASSVPAAPVSGPQQQTFHHPNR